MRGKALPSQILSCSLTRLGCLWVCQVRQVKASLEKKKEKKNLALVSILKKNVFNPKKEKKNTEKNVPGLLFFFSICVGWLSQI